MRPTKTRTRRRSLSTLAVLLIAGGCGGGDADVQPPRPTIERATAEQLAATSDSIADSLDAGDVCTAAQRADDLRAQVIEAINARKIPDAFQEDVLARAQELVNSVNCPPPPQEETENEDDEKKKEKKEKKEEKQEDDDELDLPTEPIPTEPLP